MLVERRGANSGDSGATTDPNLGSWVTSIVIAWVFSKDTVREAIANAIVSNRLWQTDLQSIVTPLRLDPLQLSLVRAIAARCKR